MKLRLPTRRSVLTGFLLAVVLAGLWAWLSDRPRYTLRYGSRACCFGFSPDGRTLWALGSKTWAVNGSVESRLTGPIRVWDADAGKLVRTALGKEDVLGWLQLCPDGRAFVFKQDEADRVKLFDACTGEERVNVRGTWGCISPDGRYLAFDPLAPTGGKAKVLDLATARDLGTLASESPFWFSPDGKTLVTAVRSSTPGSPERVKDDAGEIELWNVAHMCKTATLYHPEWFGMAFHPDGRQVAVRWRCPGPLAMMAVYDIATGQLSDPGRRASSPVFVRGGGSIAGFVDDPLLGRCVKCWDVATQEETAVFPVEVPNRECRPGLTCRSADGQTLAATMSYDAPSSFARLFGRSAWVPRWLPDRTTHRITKVWDLSTGQELASLPRGGEMFLSPDGKLLALARRSDGVIDIWDVPPRKSVAPFLTASAGLLVSIWAARRWQLAAAGRRLVARLVQGVRRRKVGRVEPGSLALSGSPPPPPDTAGISI